MYKREKRNTEYTTAEEVYEQYKRARYEELPDLEENLYKYYKYLAWDQKRNLLALCRFYEYAPEYAYHLVLSSVGDCEYTEIIDMNVSNDIRLYKRKNLYTSHIAVTYAVTDIHEHTRTEKMLICFKFEAFPEKKDICFTDIYIKR